jgi:DNA-binding transcriptional LysR family regulator
MSAARNVLTPEALAMVDTIARTGSFAAAARELGKVPSALTYNVRQLEDALDVLLFDRSSRQARLTPAGQELLHEGRRLLEQVDAVANRVRRVGTGWETQLSIAADDVMSRATLFELCEAFYALRRPVRGLEGDEHAPGTRLRLRTEVLAGTWEALVTGAADLAIGVSHDATPPADVAVEPLGELAFVFAVAPHHALAAGTAALSDAELVRHRAVAVADSAQRLARVTVNLLPGQDVLTVPSMRDKLEVQLRGLGCGFLPEPIARPHLEAGQLVAREVLRPRATARLAYAWRCGAGPKGRRAELGLALQWWLEQLRSPATRRALVERQAGPLPGP